MRAIKHIEFVRIGTKIPAVLPQRITRDLVRMLRKHHPLWMSLHFTHPDGADAGGRAKACARLADAGIPLGSQTVLLKGINDDVAVMKPLMHGLLMRAGEALLPLPVRPDQRLGPLPHAGRKGLEIIRGLRGHTTGYAMPMFVDRRTGRRRQDPARPRLRRRPRRRRSAAHAISRASVYRYPDPDGTLGRA